jgi:hypothetical protein
VPRSEHRGSPHFCSWLLRITLAKTGAALLFRGPRNSSSTCFVGSNKFDETGTADLWLARNNEKAPGRLSPGVAAQNSKSSISRENSLFFEKFSLISANVEPV